MDRTTGDAAPTDGPGKRVRERKRERGKEDQQFLPVIVERTDEARRHPDDVLQLSIEEEIVAGLNYAHIRQSRSVG